MKNGLRINGIDEGSSVWNSVKLLGRTTIDECNNDVVLKEGGKDYITLTALGGKTMLWRQRLGHIREKGLRALQGNGMFEGMADCTLDFDL